MGFGDVKLAAVLGAFLGWERLLVGIFLAVTVGAVGGIIARMAGGERLVPFGPYLLLGAMGALFFGDAIIAWYLGLFAV
ncbi:MAG TPA: A24 family peptidase, partial [Trueperaceae bacterium]|nr:A24 family peptidase [Trueperaceae bacterium]